VTFTPARNYNGVSTLIVKLHDNGGVADGGVDTSATQMLTITITSVNDIPQVDPNVDPTVVPAPKPLAFVNNPVNARPDVLDKFNGGMIPNNVVLTGNDVDFTVTAYDVDLELVKNQQGLGNPLVFTFVSNPALGVTFTNQVTTPSNPYSTSTVTANFSIAGIYVVTVTISDGITSTTSSLTFNVNTPPVLGSVQLPVGVTSTIAIGDDVRTFTAYRTATRDFPASDPDNDVLTYIWSYKLISDADDQYRQIITTTTNFLVLDTLRTPTFTPFISKSGVQNPAGALDIVIQCVVTDAPTRGVAAAYTSTPLDVALANYPAYRSDDSTRTIKINVTNPGKAVKTKLSTIVRNPINQIGLFSLGGKGFFQIDARYVKDNQLILQPDGNPPATLNPLTLSLIDPTSPTYDKLMPISSTNVPKADPTTKTIKRVSCTNNITTVTTDFPHGFVVNEFVQINITQSVGLDQGSIDFLNNGQSAVKIIGITPMTFDCIRSDGLTHANILETDATGFAVVASVVDLVNILNLNYPLVNLVSNQLPTPFIDPSASWLTPAKVTTGIIPLPSNPYPFTLITADGLNTNVKLTEGVSLMILRDKNPSDPTHEVLARRMIPITTKQTVVSASLNDINESLPGEYDNTFITGRFGFGKVKTDLVSFRGVVNVSPGTSAIIRSPVMNKISVGLGNIVVEGLFTFGTRGKTAKVNVTAVFDDGKHTPLTAKNVPVFRVQQSGATGLLINVSLSASDLAARGFDTAGVTRNPKARFGFDPPPYFKVDAAGNVVIGQDGSVTPIFIQSSVLLGQDGNLTDNFDSVVRSFFYVKNGIGIVIGQNFKTK